MIDLFSNAQLQKLIAGQIIGSEYPYASHEEQEIVTHINRLFHRINRLPHLVCEADWNHFGSGYASFIEFYCYTKEDCVIVEEQDGIQEIQSTGIIIDISRLAPVAIMGEDIRTKSIQIETQVEVSSVQGSIIDNPHSFQINEHLQVVREKLLAVLTEFNYQLLTLEEVNQPLAFQASISTIYRRPRHYLVLDVIFYWED